MKAEKTRFIARNLLAAALTLLGCSGIATAGEPSDSPGEAPASPAVHLGTQPLGYPPGVISAVMGHDRILHNALAESGLTLKSCPFRQGADMLPLLADHRLEAAMLGDIPTILAAATGQVWIVGLAKQGSIAIVVKGDVPIRELAGKRIGIVENSTAQYTLLQRLASVGLAETQVRLVSLSIDDMPAALERGDIDAFAAWEPATVIALSNSNQNHIVFRGLSTAYFVIGKDFAQRYPEAALQVTASFVRAIAWMRRSRNNLERAARWAMADGQAFSGKPAAVSVEQLMAVTRRDILNVPSAPAMPVTTDAPLLKDEFQFLSNRGKLPAGAQWDNVIAAFTYDGLAQVMTEPQKYKISTFDYEE